jgi:hypothetical protein
MPTSYQTRTARQTVVARLEPVISHSSADSHSYYQATTLSGSSSMGFPPGLLVAAALCLFFKNGCDIGGTHRSTGLSYSSPGSFSSGPSYSSFRPSYSSPALASIDRDSHISHISESRSRINFYYPSRSDSSSHDAVDTKIYSSSTARSTASDTLPEDVSGPITVSGLPPASPRGPPLSGLDYENQQAINRIMQSGFLTPKELAILRLDPHLEPGLREALFGSANTARAGRHHQRINPKLWDSESYGDANRRQEFEQRSASLYGEMSEYRRWLAH